MKKIYLLAAAALALAACDKNDDKRQSPENALQVTATIGESTLTRADKDENTPISGDHDKWADGDCIGITSTVGSAIGPFINYKYVTDGDGKFTGDKDDPLFYYKPMTLTAYYPFTGEKGKFPGVIEAKTGAEQQTDEMRPKIDFLWDIKKGKGVDKDQEDFSVANPNVNFKFAHKMSKLTFKFQGSEPAYDENGIMVSDGVDVRTMVSYKIEGLGITGTFDTATGDCNLNADSDSEREGLTIGFEKETKNVENKYTYTREFPSLIVFPQTKPKDKDFILHITTDELEEGQPEQNYKCTLKFTDEGIKPGNHYNFTIKVTRRGLIVGDLEIKPWEETEKFIIATIDGEEKFEEQPAENQN